MVIDWADLAVLPVQSTRNMRVFNDKLISKIKSKLTDYVKKDVSYSFSQLKIAEKYKQTATNDK